MADEVRIRPASGSERERLGALKLRASLAWGDLIEELQALPDAGQVSPDHLPFVFVAEAGGEVIGFATVLPKDGREAELEDLFVAPEAWRRGVGARLIAEAERRAVGFGARALHVVANGRALAFYEACGFSVVGTVATRFESAPEMRKELD